MPATAIKRARTTKVARAPKASPKRTSAVARSAQGVKPAKPVKSAKPAKPRPLKAPPPIPMPKAARAAKVTLAFKPTPGAKTEVLIGSGLIPDAPEGLVRAKGAALVVIDAGLPRAQVEPLLRALDRAGVRWGVSVVTADEQNKTLKTLHDVLVQAATLRLERNDLLIAVGGGVVCDTAGLAAALYRRGVRHVLCPTTLLSMVDGAIGGKTVVNIAVPGDDHKARLLKNMVGAFHQPARVVCDTASLGSLHIRHLRAGLAECIKHGLIGGSCADAGLLDFTAKRIEAVLRGDIDATADLVARHIKLKARVVQADEREMSDKPDGGRMMLNLGHTFAHAIETLHGLSWHVGPAQTDAGTLRQTQMGPLLHGEAVGLGLLAAASVAEELKLAPKGLRDQVSTLLTRAGLPTHVMGLPPAVHIVDRMIDDKKTSGGQLRLVLPVRGWKAKVAVNPARGVVERAVEGLKAEG